MPTLVLREKGDSEFYAEGRPDLPAHEGMRLPSVLLHATQLHRFSQDLSPQLRIQDAKDMNYYFSRLLSLHLHGEDAHARKPFASAYFFAYLAWGAYERQKDPETGGGASLKKTRNLVARAV